MKKIIKNTTMRVIFINFEVLFSSLCAYATHWFLTYCRRNSEKGSSDSICKNVLAQQHPEYESIIAYFALLELFYLHKIRLFYNQWKLHIILKDMSIVLICPPKLNKWQERACRKTLRVLQCEFLFEIIKTVYKVSFILFQQCSWWRNGRAATTSAGIVHQLLLHILGG